MKSVTLLYLLVAISRCYPDMTRYAIGCETICAYGNKKTHHNTTFRRSDVAIEIEERDGCNKRKLFLEVKRNLIFIFFF